MLHFTENMLHVFRPGFLVWEQRCFPALRLYLGVFKICVSSPIRPRAWCVAAAGQERAEGQTGSRPPLQHPPVTRSYGSIHLATGWVNVLGRAGESASECVATGWESSAAARACAGGLTTVGSIVTPVSSGSKSQNLHLFPGKSSLSPNGRAQSASLNHKSPGPSQLSFSNFRALGGQNTSHPALMEKSWRSFW